MKEESVQTTIRQPKRSTGLGTPAPKAHSSRKFLRRSGRVFVPAFAMLALVVTFSALAQEGTNSFNRVWGDRYQPAPQIEQQRIQPLERTTFSQGGSALRRFVHWNEVANSASALDHAPVPPGDPRIFGQQLGPGRQSRAMAIVHVAMFDSVNAIQGGYRSFTGIPRVHDNTSVDSAIAQSAHDTLVFLYPSQAATFDRELGEDLDDIPDGNAKARGIALGRRAAAAIVALKRNDGSAHAEPRLGIDWFTSNLPGRWRQDPISLVPIALGAHWEDVDPFVLRSASQFRIPPPPALNSQAYTTAFREVKRLGGDGIVTPTERTRDQTIAGIYWGYDGTPHLGAPPRLYNQIAMQIADDRNTNNVLELARLMALVNVAMCDSGIAAWESKYFHDFWRPITGIREASPGTGPTGRGDGNPNTRADPTFTPLGAPFSNATGPNFTPPFPAYASGHATFGAALFQTLRNFYGTDSIRFTFVSDEFNGVTRDNQGNVRPLIPRSFRNLSEAEEENGQSRIYLGIHWAFDKTAGITQGRSIANYVFQNAFRPVHGGHDNDDGR
ncbi:MAG: vanadium-dependent haloperoxidase [Pyrinomonadaceae bacterium]|nr:vanadium-dependent haloperoxidase [Pyrinomonadaceae bacterium]